VAGFVYLVPMFAVTFSRWLLDEPVTPALVIGVVILVGGVWLINRRQMSGRQAYYHFVKSFSVERRVGV
jgi:drug/metabolite transporter (DMT)-like permease